jgi:hypothetical protein
VPAPGGTHLMVVTFPPDSLMMRPEFGPMAWGPSWVPPCPGSSRRSSPTARECTPLTPSTTTSSLEGEMVLELDDGQTVALKKHDVVVQHGTRAGTASEVSAKVAMLGELGITEIAYQPMGSNIPRELERFIAATR